MRSNGFFTTQFIFPLHQIFKICLLKQILKSSFSHWEWSWIIKLNIPIFLYYQNHLKTLCAPCSIGSWNHSRKLTLGASSSRTRIKSTQIATIQSWRTYNNIKEYPVESMDTYVTDEIFSLNPCFWIRVCFTELSLDDKI